MGLFRFLLILTAALIALLLLLVWFVPLDDDFRTGNPSWNGSQYICAHHEAIPVDSLADLPDSPQHSTLILIPYLDFTPAELDTLHHFVIHGGTLILADDYGYGNQVLERLGLAARFSGQSLLDPILHYKNKWLPRITRFYPGTVTSGIDSIVLNHATTIDNLETGAAIALSSSFSFLDRNGNSIRDDDEPNGPLPVISRHHLGSGRVFLVTDPSIFINSMETVADNNAFLQTIASSAVSGLYIDQSHLPPSNLYHMKSLLIKTRDFFTSPVITVELIIMILLLTLSPIWYKPAGRFWKGDSYGDRFSEGT